MTDVRQADPATPAPRESVAETVRRLAAAQKSSKGAPAYSRFVNRPMGRLFAALAYRLGLTPDAVTVISACFTFAAIGVLVLVPPSALVAAAVCAGLVVGYALDAADGQLARLRGGGSLAGEWLDHMVDAVKVSSLHIAVAVALYRFGRLDVRLVLVPLAFTVVSGVHFFGMILTEQLRRRHATGAVPPPRGSTLRALAVLPVDYGVLCLVFALLARPPLFVAAYTVLFMGSLGYLALALRKWYRDMRELDARQAADRGVLA